MEQWALITSYSIKKCASSATYAMRQAHISPDTDTSTSTYVTDNTGNTNTNTSTSTSTNTNNIQPVPVALNMLEALYQEANSPPIRAGIESAAMQVSSNFRISISISISTSISISLFFYHVEWCIRQR